MAMPSLVADNWQEDRIPIFDSLTHPSLDGSWLFAAHGSGRNCFQSNIDALRTAGVRWAWAVAMGNTGAYDASRYAAACADSPIPMMAAAFAPLPDFKTHAETEDWLRLCKQQGYRGVKLHPRLAGFDLSHPQLAPLIIAAHRLDLIPFLCTYFHTRAALGESLTLDALQRLLRHIQDAKLVLLHGGCTRLLDVAECTRHFRSVLLDVSWTMCEYEGSSVDLDLAYVFRRCWERVCIGSDSPEYTPSLMRSRFEDLTAGLTRVHRERIAYRNLLDYSGLTETT